MQLQSVLISRSAVDQCTITKGQLCMGSQLRKCVDYVGVLIFKYLH